MKRAKTRTKEEQGGGHTSLGRGKARRFLDEAVKEGQAVSCVLKVAVMARDFGTNGVEVLWVQAEIVDRNCDCLLRWLAHEDGEAQRTGVKDKGELTYRRQSVHGAEPDTHELVD